MTFLEAYAASMPAGMPKAPMWWCLILTCRGCSQTVRLSTRRYEPLLRLLRYSGEGGPRLTKPFHPPAVLWRLELSAGGHILATAGDRPTDLRSHVVVVQDAPPPTTLSNEPRTATGNAPAPVPVAGRRCGTLVRGMLGEPVINCNECGWPILVASSPQICPRCVYAKQEG